DAKALQRAWPEEAERLKGAAAWRVTGKDWGLRLAPRPRGDGPAPVRVFLAEHAAAVPDGRGWLHEACYRLYHAAGGDLRGRLAAAPDDALAERLKGLEERSRQLPPPPGPEARGGAGRPEKPDEEGPAEELAARGTPLYWQGDGGRAPEVGLTVEATRQDRLA